MLGNSEKSARAATKGKNVHKQAGESLIINQGGMGPALWGQDIEIKVRNLTLTQSFPRLSFSRHLGIFVPSANHLY